MVATNFLEKGRLAPGPSDLEIFSTRFCFFMKKQCHRHLTKSNHEEALNQDANPENFFVFSFLTEGATAFRRPTTTTNVLTRVNEVARRQQSVSASLVASSGNLPS